MLITFRRRANCRTRQLRACGPVGLIAWLLAGVLCACGSFERASASEALDWPNWRGQRQNRVSTEKGLIDRWDPAGGPGSNLLWKNADLGGRSTPIVMRGRLYTIARDQPGTANEGARVVCVDAATGEQLWQHRMSVYLTDVPDTRVGWSSCVGDPQTGRVYAQSVSGYFCCLDGDSGEVLWSRSLHEEFGLLSTFGGRTNQPLVFEDLVIVSAVVIGWGDTPEWGSLAKPAHRFLAFDKATGELRWLDGTGISPTDTTYSTPTIAVIGGQALMVFGSGDGKLWALQPRTGKQVWYYPLSKRGLNVSPLIVGDTVYMSHSEENILGNSMGGLVAIDGTMSGDLTGRELWQNYQVMAGKSSPVMVDGKLWVVDDRAKLLIFDPATGEQLARKPLGTVMRSTPLVADGKVYLCTNNGRWYVLVPTDSGVQVVHKLRLAGEMSDGSPIAAEGRIYLPTSDALYCLGQSKQQPSADPLPAPPTETPIEDDLDPAQLQVVPYDVLLAPGEQRPYRARLYNARGQFLREVGSEEAEFRVVGGGSIDSRGVYVSPADAEHEVARVVCRVGALEGGARVRIVPPLPWWFHFEGIEKVPLTWVGGRVRYVVRQADGQNIVAKRSVLPTPRDPNNKLGTRSRMWMGSSNLSGYTIQADVALTQNLGRLPDFGLINSRYTMTIRSSNRQLRLYSWSPHDFRTYAAAEFLPETDRWYTMKLRVEPAGDRATVRGKIWPREQAEPTEWAVEMVDHSPNLQGSPGLYGNASEAEILLDNLVVVPNE